MNANLAVQSENAAQFASEAREAEGRQEQAHRDASLAANAAAAARDTLEKSVGATARDITDRLEAARRQ
jgi:hypothetical protein